MLQAYVLMLPRADHDRCSNRKAGMARRVVQYMVSNVRDADVGPGAPGFRATWQSKDRLKQQGLERSDVPTNGTLDFWDGQLWIMWDDADDLPGPDRDPLRIRIFCPQGAGMHLPSCACSHNMI